MACCVFAAFVIQRILKLCETLDVKILNIQYNDFDAGFVQTTQKQPSKCRTAFLDVDGMTCAACSQIIQQTLHDIDGVERCSVSQSLNRATILYDSSRTEVAYLTEGIENAGYAARVSDISAESNLKFLQQSSEADRLRRAFASALSKTTLTLALSWSVSLVPDLQWLGQTKILQLSTLAGLAGWIQLRDAIFIHKSCLVFARRGVVTMDTLLSLSLILAAILCVINMIRCDWTRAELFLVSSSSMATLALGARYLSERLSRDSTSILTSLFQLQAESQTATLANDKVF